jgi:GTP cyclohydrolase I
MQLAGSSIGAAAAAGAAAPAVAELGPPTPDEQSLDPSDASSDDMSADLPWYMAVREVAAACGGSSSNGTTQAAHSAQQQQQRQLLEHEEQQQQQEQEEQQGAEGLLTFCAPFSSQCEHHLLPFYGRLKLVYLPARGGPGGGSGAAAADLSTDRAMLAHIVDMYSKRLQVQERLTHQVADAGGWQGGRVAVQSPAVQSPAVCCAACGLCRIRLCVCARCCWPPANLVIWAPLPAA